MTEEYKGIDTPTATEQDFNWVDFIEQGKTDREELGFLNAQRKSNSRLKSYLLTQDSNLQREKDDISNLARLEMSLALAIILDRNPLIAQVLAISLMQEIIKEREIINSSS